MSSEPTREDLAAAYRETAAVYERQASTWDRQRSRALREQNWLDRFLASLPKSGPVLDLGCGAGEPIARFFISHGRDVIGVDYSAAMLSLARERFPEQLWLQQDMRELQLDCSVAGAVSWDGLFHLSPDEQRRALPAIAATVAPGGAFLATVGWGEGEAVGQVGGEAVYHGSLEPDEYLDVLGRAGFQAVTYHEPEQEELDRWVVFARNKRAD